jgi:hypothetical protein
LAEICDELVISENGAQSLVDSLRRASLLNYSQRHRIAGVFFTPRLAEIMGRPACARQRTDGCSIASSRGFSHTTPPTVTHEARPESGGRVVGLTNDTGHVAHQRLNDATRHRENTDNLVFWRRWKHLLGTPPALTKEVTP